MKPVKLQKPFSIATLVNTAKTKTTKLWKHLSKPPRGCCTDYKSEGPDYCVVHVCSMKSPLTSATKKLTEESGASRHAARIRPFVLTKLEPLQEELVRRALKKRVRYTPWQSVTPAIPQNIPDEHAGEILMADAILQRMRDRIRFIGSSPPTFSIQSKLHPPQDFQGCKIWIRTARTLCMHIFLRFLHVTTLYPGCGGRDLYFRLVCPCGCCSVAFTHSLKFSLGSVASSA